MNQKLSLKFKATFFAKDDGFVRENFFGFASSTRGLCPQSAPDEVEVDIIKVPQAEINTAGVIIALSKFSELSIKIVRSIGSSQFTEEIV